MADINVERKTGTGWLWWVLGLIILALLIWWVAAPGDEEVAMVEPVAEQPIVTPATTPEVVGMAPEVSIADILANPAMHVGTEYMGEVTVVEVPTDRGFWIEDQGQRLFVILNDQPAEEPLDINPGQTLMIEQGTLRDQTFLPQIPGEPLDAQTQQIAEDQPIFLTADESNINILTAGTPQPGTDPAQSVQ